MLETKSTLGKQVIIKSLPVWRSGQPSKRDVKESWWLSTQSSPPIELYLIFFLALKFIFFLSINNFENQLLVLSISIVQDFICRDVVLVGVMVSILFYGQWVKVVVPKEWCFNLQLTIFYVLEHHIQLRAPMKLMISWTSKGSSNLINTDILLIKHENGSSW